MFSLKFCRIVFPADYCSDVDMQHLGKYFLRNAKFFSEIADVSWRSADKRFRGNVDVGFCVAAVVSC